MTVKNIIIVNDFAYINGGAGNVALNSAICLKKQGYNVVMFSAVGPICEEILKNDVHTICLKQYDILNNKRRLCAIRQGIWNKKAKKAFKELLRQFNPSDTIIHFHGWMKALSSSLFSATARYGYKIVVTLHDYFLFCPNGGVFNYQTKKICYLQPASLKCLLCNCDVRSYQHKIWRYTRQIVQSYIFRKNREIYFIYISKLNQQISYPYLNSISKKWYFVQNPIDIIKRHPVDIIKNKKYLFIARLSYEKGIEMFCQAITDLNLEACVLGDGYLRENMQAKYPNIEFVGWVTGNRKERLINEGKALVFSSLWYEGAPLTILEMKSYGIPCIVPDKCSASEQIEDGKTGFIFRSGNIEALKEAILKYEQSDIVSIQSNIFSSFNPELYSIENHCNNLVKVYNDILMV